MPAAPSNRQAVFIIVGCLAALAFVGVLLVSSVTVGWYVWNRPYTHDAFQKRFLGLTASEVRSVLGAPDGIERPIHFQPDGNEGYWLYHKRTVDEATGKVDASENVWLTNGRCDEISFTP